MKIEVLKNKRSKWYWRLVAANGKVLAHSETYSSKQMALKTAKKIAAYVYYCSPVPVEVVR